MGNRILVVAAHPDDEVLGCGATIAALTEAGKAVQVLFCTDGLGSRGAGEKDRQERLLRQTAAREAGRILGTQAPLFLDFPDNGMDQVALLDIVKSVEAQIAAFGADTIFTHHGGDLNVDHRLAYQAVMTAARPLPGADILEIYSFEIVSSTHWSTPDQGCPFNPMRYHDVSIFWEKKAAALDAYAMEMRAYPHARSMQAVEALARFRGSVVGLEYAEAFQVERQLVALHA